MRKVFCIVIVLSLLMFSGCSREYAKQLEKEAKTDIANSKYSVDTIRFDYVKSGVKKYFENTEGSYEKNTTYTLTEIMDKDEKNIVLNTILEACDVEKKGSQYILELESDAFKGTTSDKIIISVEENQFSVSVDVNSEYISEYQNFYVRAYILD